MTPRIIAASSRKPSLYVADMRSGIGIGSRGTCLRRMTLFSSERRRPSPHSSSRVYQKCRKRSAGKSPPSLYRPCDRSKGTSACRAKLDGRKTRQSSASRESHRASIIRTARARGTKTRKEEKKKKNPRRRVRGTADCDPRCTTGHHTSPTVGCPGAGWWGVETMEVPFPPLVRSDQLRQTKLRRPTHIGTEVARGVAVGLLWCTDRSHFYAHMYVNIFFLFHNRFSHTYFLSRKKKDSTKRYPA